ncbi:hypothetical protein BO82DRAFT_354803 [Aspergillus uvarum CBS 121591]|uniref:Uncharacterized protein n=1 Tax=Aspergillus uvarum CBS 121591 TaxID=1448315 RepID=A0A319CDD9_9EURO|nr:hypothetical protein BO82DRAFT_354803 [Aspergillus uvarum CBS 121591]PYH81377.1 hypothetical protein BO82DRAFT_354803 [Aspergillus uvarum CBS 121591]
MSSASPLQIAASIAAAKVRSRISRTSHSRYPWLFISPESKDDVRSVVQTWLSDKGVLEQVSREINTTSSADLSHRVEEFYPIVWTGRPGILKTPFPGKTLVIVGLEYVNSDNGLPHLSKTELFAGDFILVSGDQDLQFSNKGGGTSLFIILKNEGQ